MERGIVWSKTGKKTLAVLLFLMANMPQVETGLGENIYNIYLDKIFPPISYRCDFNKILKEIEEL